MKRHNRTAGAILALALCLVTSLLNISSVYAAGTDEPITYTYEEAVKKATKKLSSVLGMDDQIKLLKEQRDEYDRQLTSAQSRKNSARNIADMIKASVEVLSLQTAIQNVNQQINSMKYNQSMAKVSTEMSLRNALVNVANAEMDIELMKATVALNEENVRRVEMKKQYGIASENDLKDAEQTLVQNTANLNTLYLSLENERQNLNKILQVPMSQNTVVTYDLTLAPLPTDLKAYITDKCKNEPTIKLKQITVDAKKSAVDDNRDPLQRDKLDDDYDQAVRERDDAKTALEAAIRTNYNNLEQLMKRDETLKIDLEKANDNYRTVQANLNAGLVTEYEANSVALSILNNEIAIQKNIHSYWTLQFAFANPFMLAN